MIRTLAEPNLTAISGESANFLAGGEFPIPAGYTCTAGIAGTLSVTASTQIQCEESSASASDFTPVVLAEGRISLRVLTEVSELVDRESADSGAGGHLDQSSTSTIPSIKTRRAETTVELPSGGSLAMAGMIRSRPSSRSTAFPA